MQPRGPASDARGRLARIQALVIARPLSVALVAAVIVVTPTLVLPFGADDFLHQMVLDAYASKAPPALGLLDDARDPFGFVNVFHFLDGDPQRNTRYRHDGTFPWWILPEARVNFFRPLANAAALVDHELFGDAVVGHRLHSLLWWLGVVAAFGLLLGRAAPGSSLAALALLLFAITDRHFYTVSWIANRHALIATLPAALGLLAYIRWRDQCWRPGRWLAVAGLAVGLLGGENALGMFAFLVAYEWFGTGERRLLQLAPPCALLACWAVFYRVYDFGTYGSGLYIDPIAEPVDYAVAALTRIPILMLGEFAGVTSDLSFLAPQLAPLWVAFGLITMIVIGLLLRAAWPTLTASEQRATRWLLVGAGAALLPVVAANPSDRLLLLPDLGLCWVTAVVLRCCWHARRGRWLVGVCAYGIGLRQLCLPLLGWLFATTLTYQAGIRVDAALDSAELPRQNVAESRVILVQASDPSVSMYLRARMIVQGRAIPRSWIVWSTAPVAHRWTRVGARIFELECTEGGMLDAPYAALFRSPDHAFAAGDAVDVDGEHIEIAATDGPHLKRLRIALDSDPNVDPNVVFLAWQDGALRRIVPPPIGESKVLAFSRGPVGL